MASAVHHSHLCLLLQSGLAREAKQWWVRLGKAIYLHWPYTDCMKYFMELGCFNFASPLQSSYASWTPRKEVDQTLCAILRISPYIAEDKKLLYCSMIKSQFNNCPVGWMFCSRQPINVINEVSFMINSNNQKSSFRLFLDKFGKFFVHQRTYKHSW